MLIYIKFLNNKLYFYSYFKEPEDDILQTMSLETRCLLITNISH